MKNVERNETIMKKYISIRNRKKSRGVAVIFTLGILGLLTVMALGFASTALLNRKIADNTSSADYARHIAKNIAFARATWVVKSNLITDSVYSSGHIGGSGGTVHQDFLHKMDTVLDGVELYREINDSGTILPNTARWQYVKDADGKIVGRYAFAIVPDSGHLDPVGNRGQTTVSGRYGFSEKEIGVYSLFNGDTGLNKNADSAAGIKFRTFKEFAAAFKDLDADKKKDLLTAGYRIQLGSSPDAFWIDDNKDGKKTKDEQYLRFDMPATDAEWESMTVAKLIGDGAGETDSDIKYTSTTKNSVDFIPWLKYWNHSVGSDWTADVMKKQIAANILQYNLPGPDAESPKTPHKTISDQPDSDWLTSPPTYAGIGRHPMLNEIGFSIRAKAEVDKEDLTTPEEESSGKRRMKYTPIYYITIDSGAELVYPFGSASGLKDSEIAFSGTADGSTPKMLLKFVLKKFLKDGSTELQSTVDSLTGDNKLILSDGSLNEQMLHGDIDRIVVQTNGEVTKLITESSTVVWVMNKSEESFSWLNEKVKILIDSGSAWTNSNLSLETGDWNAARGYTKAEAFWKECKTGKQQKLKIPVRSFTVITSRTQGTDGDISEAIAKRMTIQWESFTPGNVVLKYNGEQRDVVKGLKKDGKNPPSSMDHMDSEKVWMISYEVKDPLVNHYASDWTAETKTADYSVPLDINKQYPGSVFKDDGSPDEDKHHLNNTVKESGAPVALLKDTENGAEVTLESATDPACNGTSRLSSSYIRHAPMKSLWELGFISRAEAFKTLNLGRTRVFDEGTGYNARGGGTFAQGDANLLDQIKFSDTADLKDAQGKININARYHKVFEWVFNQDAASSPAAAVNWYKDLITGTASDPYGTTPVAGTVKNVICSDSAGCLSHQHSDSCTVDNCLAHLLMERSRILPFRNRADLLLDPDYPDSTSPDIAKIPGYSNLSSTDQAKLKVLQRKVRNYLLNPGNETTDEAKSKLVREQYAARFMNLLKADSDEHVYIIVLAQSIKDIGGVPAFVDWNGDGEYTPAGETPPTCEAKAKFLKTGYVRKLGDTYQIINPSSGTAPALDETKTTTTAGSYDYGFDKITGETKLIAEMIKDENTGKWKMIGYRYVE